MPPPHFVLVVRHCGALLQSSVTTSIGPARTQLQRSARSWRQDKDLSCQGASSRTPSTRSTISLGSAGPVDVDGEFLEIIHDLPLSGA